MSTVNHREAVAERKLGSPIGFVWYAWECLDDDSVLLTGCVSSGVYEKGPKKGRPKYDGQTKKVVVTEAERVAERARYEAETGNCAECGGDGKMFAGWHHITGDKWRPCVFCEETGKARAAIQSATGAAR